MSEALRLVIRFLYKGGSSTKEPSSAVVNLVTSLISYLVMMKSKSRYIVIVVQLRALKLGNPKAPLQV